MKDPAFVYIFGNREWNCYKIGRSKAPTRRMSSYSAKMPFMIKMIKCILCDDATRAEALIHQYFGPERLCGEWFRLDDERLAEIDSIVSYEHGIWYDVHNQPVRLSIPDNDLESFLYPRGRPGKERVG